MTMRLRALVWPVVVVVAIGCAGKAHEAVSSQTTPREFTGLTHPRYIESVRALCVPPTGWAAKPLKSAPGNTHQVWVSPTADTAYGVIHFDLPFPVGHDLVLWGYLREMKREQGQAELISKEWDANRGFLRFVASGGMYTVRNKLIVRGFGGWVVYAGTLRDRPVNEMELELAERAREQTIVGRSASTKPS